MEGDSRTCKSALGQGDPKGYGCPDIREETVAEAIEKGVDLIIVNAPIFRPIKDLVASRPQNQIYIDLISMTSQFMSAIPILTSLTMG